MNYQMECILFQNHQDVDQTIRTDRTYLTQEAGTEQLAYGI